MSIVQLHWICQKCCMEFDILKEGEGGFFECPNCEEKHKLPNIEEKQEGKVVVEKACP